MNKLSNLLDWFNNKNSVLVSLSGGVDSALVAYAAFQKLGGRSFAVTADYKTLAKEELDTSKNIADEIGIKHIIINYNELENENFVQNDSNRCFYCRDELSTKLIEAAKQFQLDVIVDGTHKDDLGDLFGDGGNHLQNGDLSGDGDQNGDDVDVGGRTESS